MRAIKMSLSKVFIICLFIFYIAVAKTQEKPNIILVVLDDVGWSDLSYNNELLSTYSDITTPQLDQLANTGLKFENYYVHPTCTPTRAALLTGLYSANTGLTIAAMPGSIVGLPIHLPTMPQLLRKRGYDCHMVGKWHLGHAQWTQTPVGRGFQSFVGSLLSQFDSYNKQMVKPDGKPIAVDWMLAYENKTYSHFLDRRHATLAITEESQKVIESYSTNSHSNNVAQGSRVPLFMYIAYTAAHAPLQPLPEHALLCHHIEHPWRRGMCGMIKGLDEGVGNISTAIGKHLGSNTVLIVSSDNGGAPWFGGLNRPLRGGKTSPFEGGVRVPAFAVDFTGLSDDKNGVYLGKSGRWHQGLIHVTDWLPTFMEWAKTEEDEDLVVENMDGFDMSKSFLSVSSLHDIEAKYSPRSDVLIDMYYSGEAIWTGEEVVGLRSGKWKLIQGVARDPLWYSHSSFWNINASSISEPSSERSSERSWPIIVGEIMIRILEPMMGISQFDTLRAVIIWSWIHSHYLQSATYLFNIEQDPTEQFNLAAENPEIVSELLYKINQIKVNRPKQYEYWMVVSNFQETLVTGTCTSSDDVPSDDNPYCLFAHPWIGDHVNTNTIELLHTKDVAKRLIKDMLKQLLKYILCAFLIAVSIVKVLKRQQTS